MKKNLLFSGTLQKTTSYLKVLLWILVILPVLSFAKETPELSISNPPQLPENTAVIYMTSGAVMVGESEVHDAKILNEANFTENLKVKTAHPKEKALSKRSEKVEKVKTTKPVSKNVEKQSTFLFTDFPSSREVYSQNSGFYAHGVIPTNFKVQKFSAIAEEVFENFKIQVFQRKETSYTYLLFSASQHCRISSLRAPPVA